MCCFVLILFHLRLKLWVVGRSQRRSSVATVVRPLSLVISAVFVGYQEVWDQESLRYHSPVACCNVMNCREWLRRCGRQIIFRQVVGWDMVHLRVGEDCV